MARTAENFIGRRFFRLAVVERAPNRGKHVNWLCRCDCGREVAVWAVSLKNGRTRSCGCLVSDRWAQTERPVEDRQRGTLRQFNYRARKMGAVGVVTQADIDALFAAQGGRCANPRCRVNIAGAFHRDHIIALVNGGANWPDNVQLLCAPCNKRKAAKLTCEWVLAAA